MKRFVWLLTLCMLTLLSCRRWHEFSSVEGRFSVELPGEPRVESQTIPTDAGDIVQKSFTVIHGEVVYGVTYADYPKSLVTPATRDVMLDSAADAALASLGGAADAGTGPSAAIPDAGSAATSRKTILIDRHPGREFSGPTKDGHDHRARIYLVDNRLYQLVITARHGRLRPADELRFMDSFKLVK